MVTTNSRTYALLPHPDCEVVSQCELSSRSSTRSPIPYKYPTTDGDRVVWIMRDMGDLQLHCVMKLEGRVNPERMARAVRLTMDREPILGCYLHERGWNPSWRRRDDLDQAIICSVEHTQDKDAALQRFLVRDLNPATDPLVHVHILREETDTIVVKLSHLIADAAATKQYVYLLASYYRALGTQPDLQVTPMLTGNRSMVQLLKLFTWKQIFQSVGNYIRDTWRLFVPMKYWNIPTQQGPREQHLYTLRHIEPPQFREMKAYARSLNATLNDLIIAAYMRTLHRLHDTPEWGPHRMQNTVDLRRYLFQAPERIFCLSNFVYPHFKQPLGDTLAETVQLVRDQMNHFKPNMIGTGELLLAGTLLNVLPAKMIRFLIRTTMPIIRRILPPTLTNMGRIDPTQIDLGTGPIPQAFLTASVLFPPYYAGGFSGYDETITFSGGYCATGVSPQSIEQILDGTIEELNVTLHEHPSHVD
ncbi:MAG: hypothetical protein EP343_27845 [Deltaproteobacteria bacterium]|nr:MAG: hypothetical protein EP343_27845 [Deltaproteobacteria bacterium]